MKVLSYLSMFFVVGTVSTDTTAQELMDSTIFTSKPAQILMAMPEEPPKKSTAHFFTPCLLPEM